MEMGSVVYIPAYSSSLSERGNEGNADHTRFNRCHWTGSHCRKDGQRLYGWSVQRLPDLLQSAEGQPLTDLEVYAFLARNIADTSGSATFNAGYCTGWVEALLED